MSSVMWTDEIQNLSDTKVALKEREIDEIRKQPEEIAIQTNSPPIISRLKFLSLTII